MLMGESKKIVVIVDNSPSVQSLIMRGTQGLDIELKSFDSAEGAWDYLQSNQPDLLFLGVLMPDKDGITFLKELRDSALHKDTSVVMISSKDYAQDKIIVKELGALDFLTMPMPISAVTNMAEKYLS